MPSPDVILEARNLTTVLGGRSGFLRRAQRQTRAVDNVSLAVRKGEIFGIVGESGCGKTTLGRTLLGVLRETSGEIRLGSRRVDGVDPREARRLRCTIQYLHQDASGSLDPWWTVGRTLEESLAVNGMRKETSARLDSMLSAVGLDRVVKERYPHQLSGGQLRRVALARILILAPEIVILDEPTAGLDLSIQASVLGLLRELKSKFDLTNLLISHDLSVVRLMCDRVAVMYLGRVVEQANAKDLFETPRHPYTQALLAATPRLDSPPLANAAVAGEPARATGDVAGCAFQSRCPHAIKLCAERRPELATLGSGSTLVACHKWCNNDPPLVRHGSESPRGRSYGSETVPQS